MQGTLRAAGPARITPKKEVGDWPAYAEKATRPPRHSGSKAGGLVAILHPGVKGKANSALAAAAVERFHDWLAIRIRRPHQVALLPWDAGSDPALPLDGVAAALLDCLQGCCHHESTRGFMPQRARGGHTPESGGDVVLKRKKGVFGDRRLFTGYLLRLDQSSHVCFGHNDCEAGLLQRHHIAHFVTVITVLLPVLLFHW